MRRTGRAFPSARTGREFTADAQALMAQVPQDERDRFMAYRVEPALVCRGRGRCRACAFTSFRRCWRRPTPAVMDEIVQTFETDPPRAGW